MKTPVWEVNECAGSFTIIETVVNSFSNRRMVSRGAHLVLHLSLLFLLVS